MKPTTLCLIINEKNQILLGRKKRGFGAGKYNGFGGKKQDDESFRACAVREIFEEVSLVVKPEDLEPVALMNFQFPYEEELNHINYTYIVRNYEGIPLESEEMEPQWFNFEDIPYEAMWKGDDMWIPKVLKGQLGHVLLIFGRDNDSVLYSEFKDVGELKEFDAVDSIREHLRHTK
ncbi:8-oxo-dGTP diphosphatase [uncultured Veillonella sp.]|uniref:8-oxo-dGTP diphosphatase n=1 Tax=uncultured Veillonella sp. TaxID=159268 RepID=UPI0025CC95CF|nr:8-oxo-dGTP diphosphatase [uncultured Veillonella sp.]MDY3974601.1 8-oxo-dGTP diphosphatase [Veillonella caviae]